VQAGTGREQLEHVRVAVIGSGFAGLGMAIRLKQEGVEEFVVIERADDVGGTWRDNSYPGCACDVPSQLYSFSFAPNPGWRRSFSPQPEIHDYLRGCVDAYRLRPHIRLGHEMLSASWDEAGSRWLIETRNGRFTAHTLVLCMGALSEPSVPSTPGLESFRGTVFHSASWNHEHDLTVERVAVIGTGASAIQFVPRIQPVVGELHLFQRTPPWVIPRMDRAVTRPEHWLFRWFPATQRLCRACIYLWRESLVPGFAGNKLFIKPAEIVARLHLRRQVRDSRLRDKLRPAYTMGCKRVLVSSDYYPSLENTNVRVHTEPVREVRPTTVVTEDGVEWGVDTVILGTGFQVADWPAARRVRGRGGLLLRDAWRDGKRAYVGTTIAGFPNLFMLVGPNTFLAHSSVVFMIESQINYVLDCLRLMEQRRIAAIEVRPQAQAAFNAEVQTQMRGTVWDSGGCASWYLDASGRNSTLWPAFTWQFRRRTRRFDAASYVLHPAH
jgi:cation diffusion facilitator CzcD-associated flavoprotein CzcO